MIPYTHIVMDEDELITQLKEDIKQIKERLIAVEREQRKIREDILSGSPAQSMQKRILEKPAENYEKIKRKIDDEIKIEI